LPRIVGVIPAAGRSTRIGNPKPLLDADGRTFLDRAVWTLRQGGLEEVLVGVRESRGPTYASALRTGARVVVPVQVDDGPIATIRAALQWTTDGERPGALVILPVDHPRVEPATVSALVDAFVEGDASLVLPVFEGRSGHPILIAGPLLDELEEPELAEGARTVVRRHRETARLLEVPDRGILVDIDTLPEYRRHFPEAYRKRFQKW
jgi:molybdenum cofactor cytidylyltransferase